MNIIVDLHIICKIPGENYVHSTVGKEYKTDLVPMAGMGFEDPAWKDPRTILGVTINPIEGYYYLNVGTDDGDDEYQCEQLKKMYHSHGWTRFNSLEER